MDEEYCPKQILEEIMWFHFQGIFEHSAYHSKGPKTLLHSLFKVLHMF